MELMEYLKFFMFFWKYVKVPRSTDESANLYWLGFSINLEEARAHKMVRNQDRPIW
jgi:hypothetical protein